MLKICLFCVVFVPVASFLSDFASFLRPRWSGLIFLKKLKKILDEPYLAEYTYSMKNQKEQKAKRPSKKVLMAEIEAKGVDKTIVASLARANIETMQWVKSLLD